MDEQHLEIELRLAALEYVVTHVARISLLAAGGREGALDLAKAFRQGASDSLQGQTFSNLDAGLADRTAGELRRRVDKVLSGVEETLANAREGNST